MSHIFLSREAEQSERLLLREISYQMIGLFCRISSLLQGSFAKETYHFKEPTTRSQWWRIVGRYDGELFLKTKLGTKEKFFWNVSFSFERPRMFFLHAHTHVHIHTHKRSLGLREERHHGNVFLTRTHVHSHTYSQLQIGWHSISRLFIIFFQRTRIKPMGFTISTK